MENIIVILAVAAAVWYLFKRYKKTVDSDNPGCGGGCGGCGESTAPPADHGSLPDQQNPNHKK